MAGYPPDGVSVGGDFDFELLRYHCAANIVVSGGQTLEPVVLNAVLDSGSDVTDFSECLLKRLQAYFAEVQVSRLIPGVRIVSVADGREFEAHLKTKELKVTLHAAHGQRSFGVAFIVLPRTDVMIIGSKILRERLHIDIMTFQRAGICGWRCNRPSLC